MGSIVGCAVGRGVGKGVGSGVSGSGHSKVGLAEQQQIRLSVAKGVVLSQVPPP